MAKNRRLFVLPDVIEAYLAELASRRGEVTAQVISAQALTDTQPEIAKMVRDKTLARSGEERFVMGTEMFEAARAMVLASLPATLSDAERKRQLFKRIYGMELPA